MAGYAKCLATDKGLPRPQVRSPAPVKTNGLIVFFDVSDGVEGKESWAHASGCRVEGQHEVARVGYVELSRKKMGSLQDSPLLKHIIKTICTIFHCLIWSRAPAMSV